MDSQLSISAHHCNLSWLVYAIIQSYCRLHSLSLVPIPYFPLTSGNGGKGTKISILYYHSTVVWTATFTCTATLAWERVAWRPLQVWLNKFIDLHWSHFCLSNISILRLVRLHCAYMHASLKRSKRVCLSLQTYVVDWCCPVYAAHCCEDLPGHCLLHNSWSQCQLSLKFQPFNVWPIRIPGLLYSSICHVRIGLYIYFSLLVMYCNINVYAVTLCMWLWAQWARTY